MKEVIVTGGRDYGDECMVQDVLAFINPDRVIQGGAEGADRIAREWVETNSKESITVEAEWTKYGKYAGPKRNVDMLAEYPEAIVIAFAGGKGTAHCVETAYSLNRIILMVHK